MSAEGEIICPLCLEEMDVTDQQLQPCECGYEVCLWCWHHIMDTAEKDGMEGTCPACRSPYDKDKILGKTISSNRLEELNATKRQKQQKSTSKVLETRAHLRSCRVIRRNLVYLAGLPVNIADHKILQKKEFLGQYGKVLKVAMTKAYTANQQLSSSNSCSVFVTFSKDEEALRCIQALDGFIFDGRLLRASFGTTKFCEAWLKNMPCGNRHCVYMHEVGEQEDICTKEDVMSVCASKVRQSCATTFDNTQRRTGKFFPPPIQSFCSNTDRNSAIVNPMLCHPIDYDWNTPPDGDLVKCGMNFDEASSSSKANSMISSSTSTPTVQGTKVNEPTLRDHLPFSGGVLGDFSLLNLWETNGLLSMEHNWPTVGIDPVVEGFTNKSSYIDKGTGKQCYADCRLVCQQSISMHGDVQCSSIGETAASLLHSPNSRHYCSESNHIGGQTVTCKPKDNYASFLEALSPCLEPSVSASQDILSHIQQYAFLGRESMRSTDDLEAADSFLSEYENRNIFASYNRSDTHFVRNEVDSYRPSPFISPKSSEGVHPNLCDMSIVHKDDFELRHVEYGCQIASREKHMVQKTCISEKVKRDATEESIMSDILSLDLVLDDSSLGDNLGKLLLDNDDETILHSDLINTWTSWNNSVSRFCFARIDNSVKATELKFLLGIDECKHDANLNELEMVKNYSICQTQSLHNLTVPDHVLSESAASLCHCPIEHAAESELHSTLHQSGFPSSLSQATPALRSAIDYSSPGLDHRVSNFGVDSKTQCSEGNEYSLQDLVRNSSRTSGACKPAGTAVTTYWRYRPRNSVRVNRGMDNNRRVRFIN